MEKFFLASAVAAAVSLMSAGAQATVVQFNNANNGVATSFADGTFSRNLSGTNGDGFLEVNNAQTAINHTGQNGEYILFNHSVTLNSLQILPYPIVVPTSVTVSLFDGTTLLTSAIDSTPQTAVSETFNTTNVTEVLFTFTGGGTSGPYGPSAAWYEVSNVTYTVDPVPEPASMVLLGLGMIGTGVMARRRRQSTTSLAAG
jgi:hypothetical protein